MQIISSTNLNKAHPVTFKRVHRLLAPNPDFNLHFESSLERINLESYIARQFMAAYQAKLSDFMPLLLAMAGNDGFCAAAGIRPANKEFLFLEQYLPSSIEETLSQVENKPVNRNNIAEIGNLASTRRGSSQLLFLMLTAMLHSTHLEWVAFTATPQVQKGIERLGIPLHILCDANPAVLGHTHLASWGTYYSHRPKVVATRLSEAMSALTQQKAYAGFLSLYGNRIHTLAAIIGQAQVTDEKPAFAA